MTRQRTDINKTPIAQSVHSEQTSALTKYKALFVGKEDLYTLIKYEVYALLFMATPGAMGILMRKFYLPGLLGSLGKGTVFGRSIGLRCPSKINIGSRTTIDDNCLLDARAEPGLHIGNEVIIARDTIIQAKTAGITIGDRCSIGSQSQLSSSGGIIIGDDVLLGGQSYIGGGMYHDEIKDVPFAKQGVYTRGPLIIENNVWIGANVTIIDGVKIGTGSIIGAGAVISKDVPSFTTVVPIRDFEFRQR